MQRQQRIEASLRQAFQPTHLEVINESFRHSVPPGSESHFKIVIVAEAFAQKSLVQQHQAINQALAAEFSAGLHALSIQSRTPEQWQRSGQAVRPSPECRGGSHHDPLPHSLQAS